MADAIVLATAHYDDASKVAEAQAMIEGDPMKGDELKRSGPIGPTRLVIIPAAYNTHITECPFECLDDTFQL